MSRPILMLFCILMFVGCTKQQTAVQGGGTAAQVTKAPEEVSEQNEGFQVAPPVAYVEEIQKTTAAEVSTQPAEGGEAVIAEHRWGFAVFDPQAGQEQFFTSSGVLLGSKQR